MIDLFQLLGTLGTLAEKFPTAIRAMRIFGSRVIAGESVSEALLRTSEILIAEASL